MLGSRRGSLPWCVGRHDLTACTLSFYLTVPTSRKAIEVPGSALTVPAAVVVIIIVVIIIIVVVIAMGEQAEDLEDRPLGQRDDEEVAVRAGHDVGPDAKAG